MKYTEEKESYAVEFGSLKLSTEALVYLVLLILGITGMIYSFNLDFKSKENERIKLETIKIEKQIEATKPLENEKLPMSKIESSEHQDYCEKYEY